MVSGRDRELRRVSPELPTDLMHWPDVAPTLLATIGSLVGGDLILRGQRAERVSHRRDHRGRVFGDWYTALDERQTHDQMLLNLRLHAQDFVDECSEAGAAAREAHDASMHSARRELAAFTDIMLLDSDGSRVNEAERILRMDPFKTMNKEEGEPSQERFVEPCNHEDIAKGEFARRVNR